MEIFAVIKNGVRRSTLDDTKVLEKTFDGMLHPARTPTLDKVRSSKDALGERGSQEEFENKADLAEESRIRRQVLTAWLQRERLREAVPATAARGPASPNRSLP